MLTLRKAGKRIEVSAEEPLQSLVTAVPGAYLTVAGVWTVPLSVESYLLLKEQYGRLRVSRALKRWLDTVRGSRTYMAKLAASTDATLRHVPYVAPRLAKAMRTRRYQRVGARYIAETNAVLLADDPGLGKTLQCLAGVIESEVIGPYLIIAPKTSAVSVWQREIERWLPKRYEAVVMPEYRYQRDRVLERVRYSKTTWVIVHPEMVRATRWFRCAECRKWSQQTARQQVLLRCGHHKDTKTKRVMEYVYPQLFDIEWGVIVADESHESLIVRSGMPTQRRLGLDSLQLRSDGIRIAMSGTPFESKPPQLWGTLNWLDPITYSSQYRWIDTFWSRGGYTGYEPGDFKAGREQLLWDSLSGIALRRTKAEVAQDLPAKIEVGTPLNPANPKSPVGVWLEMTGKQERAYRQMERASIAVLDSGRLEAITAIAELTRLKQLASCYGAVDGDTYYPVLPSNKFDWLVEHLEEWGYPRRPVSKVVVVSFYTGILDVFSKGLERYYRTKPGKPLCASITGRTPQRDRHHIIDRFNRSDGEQVLFLNVKAGGTAITIDTADRMVFVSETRIPDQQKQAEDRIHRVSNPRTCLYYYLRSLDTVDVGTAIDNQPRIADTHRLLDARRGVEYVRRILDLSKR